MKTTMSEPIELAKSGLEGENLPQEMKIGDDNKPTPEDSNRQPGRPKRTNLSHLSDSFQASCNGSNYLDNLRIDPDDILEQVKERYICGKCKRSRRYFCYTCLTLSPQLESKLPSVELPVPIDIIKHPKEVDGKATSIHALLIGKNVRGFIFPQLPDDWPSDPQKLLLVYPKANALPLPQYLDQFFGAHDELVDSAGAGADAGHGLTFPFERVVFIDSTWSQAKSILSHVSFLQKIPTVVLDREETLFWRSSVFERRPAYFLATIEAIYYFCVHLHRYMANLEQRPDRQVAPKFGAYNGQYDNLLYFFRFTYHQIRNVYQI